MQVHESPESASRSISRAVAASQTGSAFRAIDLPAWQRTGLALIDRLEPRLLPDFVRWENWRRALPSAAAERVSVEQLAADRVADYSAWYDTTKTLVIGSALGGAAAYLAAAFGAPFLPEPFILGFRGGSSDDSIEPHLDNAHRIAEVVGPNNPDATLISHFDPIHDGRQTGFLNHLRLKPNGLPAAYARFAKNRLEPGGLLLHLDCEAQWLGFPLSENHRYQIGGWGGIPPDEYLQGSHRINRFLVEKGSPYRGGWWVPDVDPAWFRESEWGAGKEFGVSLKAWAEFNGFKYRAISLLTPHQYSGLTFTAFMHRFAKHQVAPQGIMVGMFNQYDPPAALDRGLIPLWLVFTPRTACSTCRL